MKVREGSAHNMMHKNIGMWGKVLQVTLKQLTAMPSRNIKPDIYMITTNHKYYF